MEWVVPMLAGGFVFLIGAVCGIILMVLVAAGKRGE